MYLLYLFATLVHLSKRLRRIRMEFKRITPKRSRRQLAMILLKAKLADQIFLYVTTYN